MANGAGSDEGRAVYLDRLAALNANLGRLRVPPLIDPEATSALDDDDLAAVVRATGNYLARVARALAGEG
jgi:hypothetical protein